MRVFFIINPAAGAARALHRWTAARPVFENSGLPFGYAFTEGPGDATRLAAQAAPDHDVLVAAGGDGTVAEVVSAMVTAPANRAALGVLPFGTGNDLAQILELRKPVELLRAIKTGQAQAMDVLEIRCLANGREAVRHAVLFAGVGIIGNALKLTTPPLKRVLGQKLAYPGGLLRALWHYRAPVMKISLNGKILEQKLLYAGASNTPIAGGGLRIAPGAKISDGHLNVILIEGTTRREALALLWKVKRGTHLAHSKVTYQAARELSIHAPAGLEIAADGELIGQSPATVTVIPKAVRVLGG